MQNVLTIAGSDSGGGAGIQADLKTMTVNQVYGAAILTAITAQNTLGVQGVKVLAPEVVNSQLESVLHDIDFAALKTGMLANARITALVADKVKKYNLKNLVVDPVIVATSGDLLLKENALDIYKRELFPQAEIITPNLTEAKILAGFEPTTVVPGEILAEKLINFGSKYVLIKGGHFEQTDQSTELAKNSTSKPFPTQAVDLLYDGCSIKRFTAPYLESAYNTHGTGCSLSAAIASYLARDYSVPAAVGAAKKFITGALKHSFKAGAGSRVLNHFWELEYDKVK